MPLLIDNYDSFTFNLAQYLGELGAAVIVRRNDEISVDDAVRLAPDSIILSPGPCTPEKAGICVELIQRAAKEAIPVLGICLGHQAVGSAFGARIIKHSEIVHGKVDDIYHSGSRLLSERASPFRATRYHSLIVDGESLTEELEPMAWDGKGAIMGLQHRTLPIFGLQFHPESIASDHGHEILSSFLEQRHSEQ